MQFTKENEELRNIKGIVDSVIRTLETEQNNRETMVGKIEWRIKEIEKEKSIEGAFTVLGLQQALEIIKEFSKEKPCEQCDGTGSVKLLWNSHATRTCPECGGSGMIG